MAKDGRTFIATALTAFVALTGSAQAAQHKTGKPFRAGAYTCVKHTQAVYVRTARKGHRMKRITCVRTPVRKAQSTAWVLPAYVVRCESNGNPRAVNRTAAGLANDTPAGLYQIIHSTWVGYGGRAFAETADQATVYEQGVIAKRILAAQGPRAWQCW